MAAMGQNFFKKKMNLSQLFDIRAYNNLNKRTEFQTHANVPVILSSCDLWWADGGKWDKIFSKKKMNHS